MTCNGTEKRHHPADADRAAEGDCSSPPCYACEVEPGYMLARPMDAPELRRFLGSLLEAERALAALLNRVGGVAAAEALAAATETAVEAGEAELVRQIVRLGGAVPPDAGGPNPARPEAKREGCAAIVSRQRTLVEEIERAVPLIENREVAASLVRVRAAHGRALAADEAADKRTQRQYRSVRRQDRW